MTPAQITAARLEQNGAFDTALHLLDQCPPAHEWTDWGRRRPAFVDVYEAMMGALFEPDSDVDELLHAAFRDGWKQAIMRIAAEAGLKWWALDFAIDEIPPANPSEGRPRSEMVAALLVAHDKAETEYADLGPKLEAGA